ncbi:MAG: SpoIID/LytB domain-containing protein [Ruminococcaceae bacterium]|nr:SpoIID/LytB domain-containing protein [Oscillospiraceae bacterium]
MQDKKKKNVESGRSGLARIMSLVLVILMLLGVASTLLVLILPKSVAEASEYTEPVMSIGIQYGDTASGSFRTYSDTGYTILSQNPDGKRDAVRFGSITDKTIVVAPQANLAPSGTGFAVAATGITVGGYRIDLADAFSTYAAAVAKADAMRSAASSKGYQVFPAYIGGKFKVRVGCFASREAADAVRADVEAIAGSAVTVSAPVPKAVCVLTTTGVVRFEYENGTAGYLGLRPAGTGDVYMRADNNYIYEGAFMYKSSGSLITVINMIGLETYIEGVLPYEISSSWHIEAQKAFAIAARSYAVGNLKKHYTSYGFDLCCTTNCQVYRGAGGVNDKVRSAVAATAGEVLVSKQSGKVATLYYSSSTGGCTVSAEDCWGGTGAPYLTAISTPWERYADYGNGLWTAEVSPAELCEYLRSKGYTTLKGSIASVEVKENAKNSTYVKSLKITDTSGNSVTITNTDKVRTALSKYVKSANFVVGRGSVAYTVTKATAGTTTMPYSAVDLSSAYVMTGGGKVLSSTGASTYVLNSAGKSTVGSGTGYVLTADNADGSGDVVDLGYVTTTTNKTATASDSNNFIFAGKGWGHGVGLSQYGTKDLAEFGYTYDRILAAYVPAGEIRSYSDM